MRRARHQREIVGFVPRLELPIGLEAALLAKIKGKIVLSVCKLMAFVEELQKLHACRVHLADPLIEIKVIVPTEILNRTCGYS